jgi:phosphoribosylanthranilate isomerase
MTWIKICGTTNLEDALTAVDAGADALGFVFYEKSPRKIDPETAGKIAAKLPAGIEKVGVFVEEPVERILLTVAQAGLTAAQLHGDQYREPEFIQQLKNARNLTVFLVVPADKISGEWRKSRGLGVSAVFFDSGTPQLPGGTGRIFDWKTAAPTMEAIGKDVNTVVAGGLNSANVSEAIGILKPWGVDVASGVEVRPGKKDPEKVRAFINAVRKADKKKN